MKKMQGKLKTTISKKQFLKLFAQFIQMEAEALYDIDRAKAKSINEPYRAAGDRLTDEALSYID